VCRALTALACTLAAACTAPVESADPPELDRCAFERDVYPVLARDCGFPACHGSPDRFFRVFAPGRTRLDPATGPFEPPTAEEIDATYERARSMLAGATRVEDSFLYRKPLEPSAGGSQHMGRDRFGRNVYGNVRASGHRAIATWARRESLPCE
jgi:hypothetical protein